MQINLIHHIKKLKGKNHKIISIDAEKDSQNSTLIYGKKKKKKSLQGMGIERTFELVAQLCLTLCNPMDCSLPATDCSSVHGILQARMLE